ncbi:MAG: response regulator, partial [Clostridiales bacterium]|nr:response regulator [Clostridiales bacterium]
MSKMIYIADDEDNIRNLLKSFLEREDFNVIGFATGDDLLARFRDTPCDLIILDVMMPGHDGFFILNEIRKES